MKKYVLLIAFLSMILLIIPPVSASNKMEQVDEFNVSIGTLISGDVSNITAIDGTYIQVEEENVANGILIELNYTNTDLYMVNDWNFKFNGRYEGGSGHIVNYQLYNWSGDEWYTLFTLTDNPLADENQSILVTHNPDFVSDTDVIRTQFDHDDSGNPTHDLYIGYLEITASCTCCNITEVNITQPLEKSYPSSINIPLEFSYYGGDTCYYTLTDGVENITIPNCDTNTTFDVDFDKSYNLTVFTKNTTVNDGCYDTIEFTVDREDDEGFSQFYIYIMFFLLAVSVYVLYLRNIYDDKFQLTKGLIIITSLVSFAISIVMLGFGIREYIKIHEVVLLYNYFAMLIIAFLVILFFWNIVLIIKNTLEGLKPKND